MFYWSQRWICHEFCVTQSSRLLGVTGASESSQQKREARMQKESYIPISAPLTEDHRIKELNLPCCSCLALNTIFIILHSFPTPKVDQ
jgi:hypothetical protein